MKLSLISLLLLALFCLGARSEVAFYEAYLDGASVFPGPGSAGSGNAIVMVDYEELMVMAYVSHSLNLDNEWLDAEAEVGSVGNVEIRRGTYNRQGDVLLEFGNGDNPFAETVIFELDDESSEEIVEELAELRDALDNEEAFIQIVSSNKEGGAIRGQLYKKSYHGYQAEFSGILHNDYNRPKSTELITVQGEIVFEYDPKHHAVSWEVDGDFETYESAMLYAGGADTDNGDGFPLLNLGPFEDQEDEIEGTALVSESVLNSLFMGNTFVLVTGDAEFENSDGDDDLEEVTLRANPYGEELRTGANSAATLSLQLLLLAAMLMLAILF